MAENERPLRVFCAVELPAPIRERVAGHAARLRRDFPHVRVGWDLSEKLHLTLKFVGETEPARVARLTQAAGRAAAGVAPFSLSIEGTGMFPPRGVPRVLWLGVKDIEGGLALLQQRLEEGCAAEGFPREARAFRPHLTVGRIRAADGVAPLAAAHRETVFHSDPFNVTEMVVMRSDLGPGGSRYTPLSRHTLRA